MARIRKLLIANRGEIARRILRTARRMGLSTVAVYSDADVGAPHVREADEAVRLGPAPSLESYLSIDRLLAAARSTGADAIHPGYGFLSENAAFASACEQADLVFVGPPAQAIVKMGSKIESKEIMSAAGVPVIPGVSVAGLTDARLAREADSLGFPVLVKASAGGGGKGMRIVRSAETLSEAVGAARREAASAFGDDTLMIERYFESPRHVELQVFGDHAGRVVHCFERECSIQRRYQKIIEEAPSVAVDEGLRARMGEAAVAAAKAIGYVGAGTVEFVLDREGQFYFLEMNTRLQVEHPVTELVTGLDLVELQLSVAQGESLPLDQRDLRIRGHAIEARLYAEDPAKDFLPATGRVALWRAAELPGVRYDSGVETGTQVGVHYDPLLAKVIAHGAHRREAADRLVRALESLGIAGVKTNREFLISVLRHPDFEAGKTDTHFIDRHLPAEARAARSDGRRDRVHALAATLSAHEARRGLGPMPASIPSGWRNNRWRPQSVSYRLADEGEEVEVRYVALGNGRFEVTVGDESFQALVGEVEREGGASEIVLEIDGVRRRYTMAANECGSVAVHSALGTTSLEEIPLFGPSKAQDVAGGCVAPMTGVVRDVRVKAGERVDAGEILLVLEAMKMEHALTARAPGVVKEVRVEVGQMVDPDDVLIVVEALEEQPDA